MQCVEDVLACYFLKYHLTACNRLCYRQKVLVMSVDDLPHRLEYSRWYVQRCTEWPHLPSTVLCTDTTYLSDTEFLIAVRVIFEQT